jgi:hypothetical protein
VPLHADPVTKQSTAGERTSGVHSDDADLVALTPQKPGQLVQYRAFASAGRSGNTYDVSMACVAVNGLEDLSDLGISSFQERE